MKAINTSSQSRRVRTSVTCVLFAGCYFAAASSSALTVTATTGGTFDDATSWSAVATWDESVMADHFVFVNEMISFTIQTATGPQHNAATYTINEAVALEAGFWFDGPTSTSNIEGDATEYVEFQDSSDTNQYFVWMDFLGGPTEDISPGFGNTRVDFGRRTWVVSSIPEPSTLTLAALGLLSVGITRRRRQRA